MPTLAEITTFQFVLGLIGIPLVLGFLTEAGKDLYNMMRKKPDIASYAAVCAELRSGCKNKEEIVVLAKSDEYMLKRQNELRDNQLPEMRETLTRIEEQVKGLTEDIREIKEILRK